MIFSPRVSPAAEGAASNDGPARGGARRRPRPSTLAARLFALALLSLLPVAAAAQSAAAGQLVISEFRLRGTNGANDEYVEIYNNTDADHTVTAADGSAGYAVAASDGVARCAIPNGTVIPARGHYLCVNSIGYSLAAYPAGHGATATGDATFTNNIPDNAGLAIFRTSNPANFSTANRLDAVGSTSVSNALYKEGAGYRALTPFSIDYAFYRDPCGIPASDGACAQNGLPKDTNNNAADFVFVDTNGTSAGAGQRLGAPGPENLSSPGRLPSASGVSRSLLDGAAAPSAEPNRLRDFTSDPANNSTFGTVSFRRAFMNNTGAGVTRLRFRVVDLTTFPSPFGVSDLRPRTSADVMVTTSGGPVNVRGTTPEEPPSQPNGGGFNSTLSAGAVTFASPLAPGESVNVQLLFGIQQTGAYRFAVVVETLPFAGSEVWVVRGDTETATDSEGANAAPTANDDAANVAEDGGPGGVAVLVNDGDVDGDALTVVSVTQAAHGTAAVAGGGPGVTYEPAPDYSGPDSFTYTVADGHGGTATATVHVTVTAVNDAPAASDDSHSMNQDATLQVGAPGVLGNDADADGDALSGVLVSTTAHGLLAFNADGSFTYTPGAGFTGVDSFTYKASDGQADSNVATVTISVADTQGPTLTSSVADTSLWPNNSKLVNVGLTAGASDNGGGPVAVEVFVFGDEDDQTATAPGVVNSPDARDVAAGALRLRSERADSADGRVYLILVVATDSSGNTSRNWHTVVVPKSRSAANVASVSAQAQAALAQAVATGAAPAGYFVIGDGPVVGPNQ